MPQNTPLNALQTLQNMRQQIHPEDDSNTFVGPQADPYAGPSRNLYKMGDWLKALPGRLLSPPSGDSFSPSADNGVGVGGTTPNAAVSGLQTLPMPKGAPTPPLQNMPVSKGTPAPKMQPLSQDDDINKRADAIIGDANARENAYRWGPQSSAGPLDGLQAAGGYQPMPQDPGIASDVPGWLANHQQPSMPTSPWVKGGVSPTGEDYDRFLKGGVGTTAQNGDLTITNPPNPHVFGAVMQNYEDKLRAESLQEEKLRQPLQLQQGQIGGQMALAAQNAQQHQALQQLLGGQKLEQMRTEYEESPFQQAYGQMLQGGGQTGSGVKSFSKGGVTLNSPDKLPYQLQNKVTDAAGATAKQGATGWFGGPTPAGAAQAQAAKNVFSRIPGIQSHHVDWLTHAVDKFGINTPFDQVMQQYLSQADEQPSDQDVMMLQRAWNMAGGK